MDEIFLVCGLSMVMITVVYTYGFISMLLFIISAHIYLKQYIAHNSGYPLHLKVSVIA